MNTDNVWIVVILVIVILIGSNALMFAMVRGARGGGMNWFKSFSDNASKPWGKEDKDWSELSQRVHELELKENQAPDDGKE